MVNSITSNLPAINALRGINASADAAAASTTRLSSGRRINTAAFDVAGLVVGTSHVSRTTILRAALGNVAQGSSLLQVADGALGQIVDLLERQKAIATQASSGQLTDTNRALLESEFSSLSDEINRQVSTTNFNGIGVLAGGLGAATSLVVSNAQASTSIPTNGNLQVSGGGNTTASSRAIQAFNSLTGASLLGVSSTAGRVQFVDGNNVPLTNNGFSTVNESAVGQFSNFRFSDVTYGGTNVGRATLTATLGGIEYSGQVIAGNARPILSNGNTRIQLSLGTISLTDNATQSRSLALIQRGFNNTVIARTSTLSGVDFQGTRLAGLSGTSTRGIAAVRLTSSTPPVINNFEYTSNTGAANSSLITVQINGEPFFAHNVRDLINAGRTLKFIDATRTQVLSINTTGLLRNISNIRTNLADREGFIAALNAGFATTGTGVNFATGAQSIDTISLQLGNLSTQTLFDGKNLSVSTASSAAEAFEGIDRALSRISSVRATVGALQSRFDYAAANIQSSITGHTEAGGRITDTDIAAESTAFASSQTQYQSGVLVLAQANNLPESLLELISQP